MKIRGKLKKLSKELILFRRSLILQTKEFFQNSTLHGIRYIAESGRPIGEKVMWFCFTSTAAMAAFIIIISLWEKFQTNPTITGLDTDFHNQFVVFPTIVVCPMENTFDEKALNTLVNSIGNYVEEIMKAVDPFLKSLTSMNFDNMLNVLALGNVPALQNVTKAQTMRHLAFQVLVNCSTVFDHCSYRAENVTCCDVFQIVYTENGFCFSFNSRYRSMDTRDVQVSEKYVLYETDPQWELYVKLKVKAQLYILPNEEYFGSDFAPQFEWDNKGQYHEILISKKATFTTDDSRQLSIKQRRCIFADEMQLKNYGEDYSISGCMSECRRQKAFNFCKCIPPFYTPSASGQECEVKKLKCLHEYRYNITDETGCPQCELACTNTVYTIEKLVKFNIGFDNRVGFAVSFLTWPIIRYKREVLFGWVDLLVSFGGIASLFLGFSLLSAIEIIYYFTMRAACMLHQNRQYLYEMEKKIRRKPPPLIDLSLKVQFKDDDKYLRNLNTRNIDIEDTIYNDSGLKTFYKNPISIVDENYTRNKKYNKSKSTKLQSIPESAKNAWHGDYLP